MSQRHGHSRLHFNRETGKVETVDPHPRPKIATTYIESATGRTSSHPILAVAFDGKFLSFGICSRLIRKLSDDEREQIVEEIEKILEQTR